MHLGAGAGLSFSFKKVSCLVHVPLFQFSESWCTAFHTEISFHSHAIKTHFHMKGYAPGLSLN